jgi:integrase
MVAARLIGAYFHGIIAVALRIGLRKGNVLRLRWDDVDLEGCFLVVMVKGEKVHRVPFGPGLRALFVGLPSYMNSEWVLPSSGGVPFKDCRKRWAYAKRISEIDLAFRFHDFRHSAASRLLRHGISLYCVQKFLGHSDSGVT